jgi:hypothetical protein
MSLGPGGASPLDARSRANRRTILGGGGGGGGGLLLDFDDESPSCGVGGGAEELKNDRRAMLDEWRLNRGGGIREVNDGRRGTAAPSPSGVVTARSSSSSRRDDDRSRCHPAARDADGPTTIEATTQPSWDA